MLKNPNLKKVWKEFLRLDTKAFKTYDKGSDICNTDYSSNNLIKAQKLFDKSDELWDDAWTLLTNYLESEYDTSILDEDNEKITVANGIILYYDGRVYEPLDVVMKNIIEEEEENEGK